MGHENEFACFKALNGARHSMRRSKRHGNKSACLKHGSLLWHFVVGVLGIEGACLKQVACGERPPLTDEHWQEEFAKYKLSPEFKCAMFTPLLCFQSCNGCRGETE
eukprot:1158613-Pelagomonas_calceolata.AAC.3